MEIRDEEVALAVEREAGRIVEARGGRGTAVAAEARRAASRVRRDLSGREIEPSHPVVDLVGDEDVSRAPGRDVGRGEDDVRRRGEPAVADVLDAPGDRGDLAVGHLVE